MEKIQKKFQFVDVSSSYVGAVVDIPVGYEFLQFITQESGGYSRVAAVCVLRQDYAEAIEEIKAQKEKQVEENKKDFEKKLNERLQDLQLETAFSEIISKFKLGDNVFFYYEDYAGRVLDKLEDNIKSFSLSSVVFESKQVGLKGSNENITNTNENLLVLKNWNESTTKPFKTREEAIEGSRAYHERKMIEKEELKEKERIATEERKKKEEEDILRKAEEIKSKQDASN